MQVTWIRSRLVAWLLFFGFQLPLAEFGNFVAVAARRHAAPATPMVLRGVVKHTRGRIGAAPEIFQVRLGKKKCDLASEDDQRELFAGRR